MSIYVTKSFMPSVSEYEDYIKKVYDSGILTNQGPLVLELESKLKNYLGVQNFHYLSNGTVALQLALATLEIDSGEIITTPFSYVATTNSILWERCTPVFVDIETDNFTIDPDKIEAAITPNTKAIMAVHVFGYACNVEKIQALADKYKLKVIYDGAHAFGARYKGKSLLDYGDISTLSFHATKLFHTVEGGACIVKDAAVSDKMELKKRFGHHHDDYQMLGINAKQSEFHAAMGLALFPYISKIIQERKRVSDLYDSLLTGYVTRPKAQPDLEYNYAYYPVLFKSQEELLRVFSALNKAEIYPRRYFYPSLNTLPYLTKKFSCPISEDVSCRIACLPLYPDLSDQSVREICKIIMECLK